MNAICTHRRWRRRLDDTYDVMKRLRRSSSTVDICAGVLEFARGVGATNLLAGVIPPPGMYKSAQLSHVLLASWPREWFERYFSRGYLYRDPTIRLVREGAPAFRWKELEAASTLTRTENSIMSEATEFRLCDGFTTSMLSAEKRPVGFSLAGERLEINHDERRTLEFVCAFAAGCAIVLVEGTRDREVRLTLRQLDVLRWAAEGFTVEQIAERLTISAHTADTHLRGVRERLGVTNTVQAVAKAFRLGMIT